jgi:hypothetical protein
MKCFKALFAVLVGVTMSVVMAGTAGADPVNAKKGESLVLECDALGTIEIATNGNGQWTPGHVIGSTQMLIPYAFHFEFTSPDGDTQSDDVAKSEPRNRPLDRCTFGGTDEFGSFSGIVWLSYTK